MHAAITGLSRKEIAMNAPLNPGSQCVYSMTELVRGKEEEFLKELQPLVHRGSVRLDLSRTERIDAAGLAALISLYCDACQAGHEFIIVHPSRHIAQILTLVGLDRILLSHDAEEPDSPAMHDLAAA